MGDLITLQLNNLGINDLTIASQRDIAPVIRGNVGGGRYEVKKWQVVSEEPVKKHAKK